MTNLVYGLVLLTCQVSVPVDCVCLEEVANFVTRRKEVVVTDLVIVTSGEFGLRNVRE
jgi:hypothetical protein